MSEKSTLVDAPPPPVDNGEGLIAPKREVVQEPEPEVSHVEVPVQEEQDEPEYTPPVQQVYTQLDLPTPPEDEYDQAAHLRYELDLRDARSEALDQILLDVRKLGVPEDVVVDYKRKLKGASAEALVAFYNTGSHRNDAYAWLYQNQQQAPKKTTKPAPQAPKPTGTAYTPPAETPSSKLTADERSAIHRQAVALGVDPKEMEANYLLRAGK